jgi:hypothetical protein
MELQALHQERALKVVSRWQAAILKILASQADGEALVSELRLISPCC